MILFFRHVCCSEFVLITFLVHVLYELFLLQEICVQLSLISYCIFKRGYLLRNCFKFHTSSTLVLALQIFVVISMLCIEKERLKRT